MIEIRHRVPGRLRFRIAALGRDPLLGEQLGADLRQLDGLAHVRVNTACASLVIAYQCDRLTEAVIVEHLAAWLGDPPPASGAREAQARSVECVGCREARRPKRGRLSWLGRIGTFLLLTAYLGYVLAREYLLKRPVAQSAFSVTGVVAIVAAFPLIRDAWHETLVEKRFTIHQFLVMSLLLAIGFGEALTAFEIIYVLRGGRLLEEYVADRSRRAIRKMLALSVKDAWVVVDGVEIQVPVVDLQAGDLLVIRTGEKVPADGVIEKGEAELSEAAITGRAEPVYKDLGQSVYAGSYLENGVIYVRARSVGEDTYLARIAALVEASLAEKAPLQERADELAARLLELGTVLTIGTLVLTQSLSRAFTVMLIMSCPCSTILAASTAVSAAIHTAARRQILVKGGVYLEQVGQAECWCFDKTGTLTTEEPQVAEVVADDERALLYWAASAEQHNLHALAYAITRRAEALGVCVDIHTTCEHILGQGIRATVDGSGVLLGNRRLMLAEGVDAAALTSEAERLIGQGLTAVYVAVDGEAIGLLGIRHRVRAGAREVVAQLRARGVREICLVSGDEQPIAEGLSRELGLDACYAELLPEDKARIVRELRRDGQLVVMVGDGVNDALALSEADIGVAMGTGGSEVAIEVADIALADSDMHKLIALHELSRATLRTADQNYYFAIGTDLVGIGLGALGILSPAMGGMIHIAHTLGILVNSSRLLGR